MPAGLVAADDWRTDLPQLKLFAAGALVGAIVVAHVGAVACFGIHRVGYEYADQEGYRFEQEKARLVSARKVKLVVED